jgi:hypothetical protein
MRGRMARARGRRRLVVLSFASVLADGDRIYAVIQAALSIRMADQRALAPNGLSQEALLRAFSTWGSSFERFSSSRRTELGLLGDPIELNALGAVSAGRSREARCAVGSVRRRRAPRSRCWRHSLIKLALSRDRRQLPPSLHFNTPNPYIRLTCCRLCRDGSARPVESGQIKAGECVWIRRFQRPPARSASRSSCGRTTP